MSAIAERFSAAATSRPATWDALMPEEGERIPWQVWMRRKGSGYWLMRWATKFCRVTVQVERFLGRDVPDAPSNPNGLEEPATVWTEEEAKDLCRLIHQRTGGRYAATYEPLVVGRVHPLKSVPAVGAKRYKRFDPFKVFDFSATDAVREQATRVLIEAETLTQLMSDLAGLRYAARLAELDGRLANLEARVHRALSDTW